jgi:hypothetical protein
MGWSATDRRTRPAADWLRVVVLAALASLTVASCDVGTPGGVSGLGGPSATGPAPRACSELKASDLTWNIDGFLQSDIPDAASNPQVVIAELAIGQVRSLRITASGPATASDCSAKAERVDWLFSSPVVARVDVAGNRLGGTLVALEPGETALAALVSFGDGSPPREARPRVSIGVLNPQWRTVELLRVK